MWTPFLHAAIAGVLVLGIIGLALLPLSLLSGLWAHHGARSHGAQARRIRRLLDERH